MPKFETSSSYRPTGDQPAAIEQLSQSIHAGEQYQTLLGGVDRLRQLFDREDRKSVV